MYLGLHPPKHEKSHSWEKIYFVSTLANEEQNFYPQIPILHRCVVSSLREEPINWTWLWLSISDWSIIMIGPGGLLLVVSMYMQFQLQFYWWGCQKKKTAKLRHLILLSRVTYWAVVEMLLAKLTEIVQQYSVFGIFQCWTLLYFSEELAHYNDWSRWFAISSPLPICCPSFSFMGGVAKEYITKLGCEKYFRMVIYWVPLEMLLEVHCEKYHTLHFAGGPSSMSNSSKQILVLVSVPVLKIKPSSSLGVTNPEWNWRLTYG